MKFLNNVDVNDNNVFFTDSVMGTSESLYPNATDSVVIYSLNASDYLGAKFLVKTISGTDQSIREILAMYDGTQGYLTEYAIVSTTETGIYNDTYTFVYSSDTSTYDLVLTPSVSGQRNVHVFATGIIDNAIDYYTPVSSDISPLGISGLVLWLDAADASTITESGGAVSQWDDKSGNGYHVTQGTASLQPTTGVSTLNGKNIINFAGDRLASGSGAPTGSFTIITVTTNLSGLGTIISWGDNTTNERRSHFHWNGGSGTERLWFSGYGSASNYDTTVVASSDIFSSVVSGQTLTTFVNGVSKGGKTLSLSAFSNSGLYIGSNPDLTETLNGSIAEALVYNTALSTVDRESLESYLANKWGITLN